MVIQYLLRIVPAVVPCAFIIYLLLYHINLWCIELFFPLKGIQSSSQFMSWVNFVNELTRSPLLLGMKLLNKSWFSTSVAANDYISPFNLIHQHSLFMAFELIFNPHNSVDICQFEFIAWDFMDAISNVLLKSSYIRSAIFLSFAYLVMLSEEAIRFVW